MSNTATCGMPGNAIMACSMPVGVGRVVQRREHREIPDLLQHIVIDHHRIAEAGAAVHHPVPDSDQLDVGQAASLRVDEQLLHDPSAPRRGRGSAR